MLSRALTSVLEQTYSQLEVIVVDDASTDGTSEYLDSVTASNPRVKYLRNDTNRGACYSRNRAIDTAQGEFITGLDDDDYFLPDRVADFVEHWARKAPETIALASYYQYAIPGRTLQEPIGKRHILREDLYVRNLAGSQVFARTETMRELGGFDTRLRAWQDYDLWLRMLLLGQIEKVPKHSYLVDRSHEFERISNTGYDKVREACELVLAKNKLAGSDALRVRSQLLIYKWTLSQALKFLLLFAVRLDIAGAKAVIMRGMRNWKRHPH